MPGAKFIFVTMRQKTAQCSLLGGEILHFGGKSFTRPELPETKTDIPSYRPTSPRTLSATALPNSCQTKSGT